MKKTNTEEKKLTDTLTDEENKQYADIADGLAKKHSVSKVYPVVMIEPNTLERVVCYLKEPSYIIKLRIMDKATTLGPFSAADELREAITLREDSDAITYGEGGESDQYKMATTTFCMSLLGRLQNQFKKK